MSKDFAVLLPSLTGFLNGTAQATLLDGLRTLQVPIGPSYLGAYFKGSWRGPWLEIALRAMDASTMLRVNIVGLGSCQAALLQAPVSFDASAPK